MSNYHIQVRDQRYNPQTQEFEALVVFFENGETQSYPCAVGLPIQADLAHVTRHLVSQARSMRKRGAVELVARAPVSHAPRLAHAENLARQMLGSLGWLTSKAA